MQQCLAIVTSTKVRTVHNLMCLWWFVDIYNSRTIRLQFSSFFDLSLWGFNLRSNRFLNFEEGTFNKSCSCANIVIIVDCLSWNLFPPVFDITDVRTVPGTCYPHVSYCKVRSIVLYPISPCSSTFCGYEWGAEKAILANIKMKKFLCQ